MTIPQTPAGLRSPDPVNVDPAHKEFEDFIYLVSHDVRNSVRALLELPQWIEEDLTQGGFSLAGSLAENIHLMNVHTRRLDRMLIDLLIYSRIGRMQETGLIDWNSLVDSVLDQIQLPPGFHLHRDIRCSAIRMGQTDAFTMVSSLLSNAIKHHDRTEGRIVLSVHRTDAGQRLSVRDDGPGIPERFRNKVFEVMTTLKPRDEIEGSGMGLANIRKIAGVYGADISWGEDGERGCHLCIDFPDRGAEPH